MTRSRGERPADVVAEYERWLTSWASDETTRARVTLATAIVGEFGLTGLTPENIQHFLARPTRTGKPKSRWSKATYHAHLKDFCKWLVATERSDTNPMDDVRPVKRPRPAPKPLSEHDVKRLLSVVEGETRDWLLLAMLAGLRSGEISRVRGEEVNQETIYVTGKGDVAAHVPCHPLIWEMAQRYPRYGYWFPDSSGGHISRDVISGTIGRLFHSMGITGSIHRGRHYYGTTLRRNGVDLRTIQKLMRHANLETTAIYTMVDDEDLRNGISTLVLPQLPDVETA